MHIAISTQIYQTMGRKLKNEELGRKSLDEFKQSKKNPIVVVLDNVRSLNNIGSVFRSADAFSIEAVYLCGITAQPPHREIQKTALGATESVSWTYFPDTKTAISALNEKEYVIISVEQAEKSVFLSHFQPEQNSKMAIVFGHEVKGVAQDIVDLSDTVLEIPQLGTKHSFNISVSVGIVLWDICSKLKVFS